MAEWKAYVDDHLVGTGHVTMGAICAMANGAIYGASDGFSVRPRARVPGGSNAFYTSSSRFEKLSPLLIWPSPFFPRSRPPRR